MPMQPSPMRDTTAPCDPSLTLSIQRMYAVGNSARGRGGWASPSARLRELRTGGSIGGPFASTSFIAGGSMRLHNYADENRRPGGPVSNTEVFQPPQSAKGCAHCGGGLAPDAAWCPTCHKS